MTNRTRRNWDEFAASDPLWAVLRREDTRGRRWDEAEFLATGRELVSRVLADLDGKGIVIPSGPVLDFGCGVGRLTLALTDRFGEVHGTDIAPGMVAHARRMAAGRDRAPTYHVNDGSDLRGFEDESFAFVVSLIVLQHVPRSTALGFLREFMRVLQPGGIAVFQVPSSFRQAERLLDSRRLGPGARNMLMRLRGRLLRVPVMEMHPIPRQVVEAEIRRAGGEVVAVESDELASSLCNSLTYVASRLPTR